MLQPAFLRENYNESIARLSKRGLDAKALIDEALSLDDQRKQTQTRLDSTLAEANSLAAQIGALFKQGKADEANAAKALANALKDETAALQTALSSAEEALRQHLYRIPNLPNALVPEGRTADDNLTVATHGAMPTLHAGALPHWDLADKYSLIDFPLGVKVTGSGFPVYTGRGAQLQRALINFFLDEARKAGYTEYIPPFVVNEASGYGTGQLPDKEGQMYHCTVDDLYLVPTAEVPLTNFFRDVILDEALLPVKLTAYTPCFRREAGSYGKDVKGLNRLHQFDKVEIVQISDPETSYALLDEMVMHVRNLLEKLGLTYRVLRLCGGDMGFTSALTYDLEVYSGAQQRWLEVSSVSNFETFQANRLKCRFRKAGSKPQLAHTLNGSALALPRIVAALLENHQTPEGIVIPEVLRPYTGFDTIS